MPADVYFITAVFGLVFGMIIYDMVMYAPGERKALAKARKERRLTRSHHYKISSSKRGNRF